MSLSGASRTLDLAKGVTAGASAAAGGTKAAGCYNELSTIAKSLHSENALRMIHVRVLIHAPSQYSLTSLLAKRASLGVLSRD